MIELAYCPQVSVLIPSYQKELFLSEAIQSVLTQCGVDLELLIFDDASTDSSPSMIQSVRDPRIRYWLEKENRGVVYAMNFLIEQARGRYIAFLGADDRFEPGKLEKQISFLENHSSYAAVFTDAYIIDEAGKHLEKHPTMDVTVFHEDNRASPEWIRYLLVNGNHLCHSSALVRREVFENIGLFKGQYLQLHDYEFWLRMLPKYEIYVISEKLTGYRRCVSLSMQSLSGTEKSQKNRVLNETSQIAAEVFDRMDVPLLLEVVPETKLESKGAVEEANTSTEEIRFRKIKALSTLAMPHGCQVMAAQMLAQQWFKEPVFTAWLNQHPKQWKWLWKMTGEVAICYPISQNSTEDIALSISKRDLVQITLAKFKLLMKKERKG